MQTAQISKGASLQIFNEGYLVREIYLDNFQDGQEISIGREDSCVISIPQADISRTQLKFKREAHSFYITHHSAKIKTYLNGILIDGSILEPLTHNSEFRFDGTTYSLLFIDHEDTLLRRKNVQVPKNQQPEKVTLIHFEPRPAEGVLIYQNSKISLPPQVLKLSMLLRKASPQPCPITSLELALFGNGPGDLYPYITKLRKAIKDKDCKIIENIPKVAYRLNLEQEAI